MTWAALIELIGGVRATVWAGLLVVALICLGQRSCALAEARKALSDERAAWAKQTLEQANDVIAAQQKARAAEQAAAHRQSEIANAYEEGKAAAQAAADRVAADLRDGNLRLQQRWASCAATASLSGAASSPSRPDAGADDRAASAGRIVGAAAECDAQVRGLQALVRSDRTTP
ncbi:endopeptidase [Pseudoxanthomonas sp. X-1]|uniref:endopeptidase n=1 Tax=Pseudoxanthomonas sp. X-1 TaxID=2571115 RepID=UPI00110B990C|nr:endopeptidase [Pseudoxanthomonas sp. X-1]TMN18460.1 endopeptidase [Pseudoxanthomonas sp. X-1]UAY76039.1 endopeptidase [Pseudoxanthomonas sp. X-1]